MGADALPPSAQTTIVILLGADAWPSYPDFEPSQAFAHVADRFRTYFLDLQGFGLPPDNLLDLFNSPKSADEQDMQIGKFLDEHIALLKASGHGARDLLFYFVGHGGFVGNSSDFFLATRCIRKENPRISGMHMSALADSLIEKARHLRRFLILDCCFAAAAFRSFQSDPAKVAIVKTIDAFENTHKGSGYPAKGTTLLCSSDHRTPSQLSPDGSATMFSRALLDILSHGDKFLGKLLSLRQVHDLAKDQLRNLYGGNAPQPALHSPDQSQGDVANIPIFPNTAFSQRVSNERYFSTSMFQISSPTDPFLLPSKASMSISRAKRSCIAPMQDLIE